MNSHSDSTAMTIPSRRALRLCLATTLCLGAAMAGGSHASDKPAAAPRVDAAAPTPSTPSRLWMTVGGRRLAVTLADTDAARAFAARLPLTLDMTDLNSNEKKFDLPDALPADARRPGRIRHGDLMLYGAHTVVLFYLSFDSPYAYTRLGRVDDPSGLASLLGRGSVKVTFSAP